MELAVVINLFLYLANFVFIKENNMNKRSVMKGKFLFTLFNLLSLGCGIMLIQFSKAVLIDHVEVFHIKDKLLLAFWYFYFIGLNILFTFLVLRKK